MRQHVANPLPEMRANMAKMEDLPVSVLKSTDIEKEMDKRKVTNYVDPDFPPNLFLYDAFKNKDSYPFENHAHYKRPAEFMGTDYDVFKSVIDPNDIRPGELKDHWFLSALMAMSENPKLIESLFITTKKNEKGFYKLKLFKNGERQEITVDDYFPCYVNGGPIFTNGNGNELWVMLLEKAYAKVYGCYHNLTCGTVDEALTDLTGFPRETMAFPALADREDYEDEEDDANDLFEEMKEFDEKNYIMVATASKLDDYSEGKDAAGSPIYGHAFTILGFHEGETEEEEEVKLIHVRDNWGVNWQGAWSWSSREWDQNEEMAEELEINQKESDGTFWISLPDFWENFDGVTVCKSGEYYDTRLRGKLIRAYEKGKKHDWVLSKFFYNFEVEEECTSFIGIS